jgi:hypothetical protein
VSTKHQSLMWFKLWVFVVLSIFSCAVHKHICFFGTGFDCFVVLDFGCIVFIGFSVFVCFACFVGLCFPLYLLLF